MITKKAPIKKKVASKKITSFRPVIFSRHPTHGPLRTQLPLLPFRSVIRLGSNTPHERERVQCNTIEAVRNSASKLLMKKCFTSAGVKTAQWYTANRIDNFISHNNNGDGQTINVSTGINQLSYPIICKHIYGSRGTGNSLVNTQQELESWMRGKVLSNYIFEKYYTYSREYRIHVTSEGAFYACRKMLKRDTPEEKRFQRHDDNCVWIVEENQAFDKPVNWADIVNDCVKALKAVGLDIGAFDLKVQSTNDSKGRARVNPEWIIIESCSAPSFGTITTQKYIQEVPKLLKRKYGEQGYRV